MSAFFFCSGEMKRSLLSTVQQCHCISCIRENRFVMHTRRSEDVAYLIFRIAPSDIHNQQFLYLSNLSAVVAAMTDCKLSNGRLLSNFLEEPIYSTEEEIRYAVTCSVRNRCECTVIFRTQFASLPNRSSTRHFLLVLLALPTNHQTVPKSNRNRLTLTTSINPPLTT